MRRLRWGLCVFKWLILMAAATSAAPTESFQARLRTSSLLATSFRPTSSTKAKAQQARPDVQDRPKAPRAVSSAMLHWDVVRSKDRQRMLDAWYKTRESKLSRQRKSRKVMTAARSLPQNPDSMPRPHLNRRKTRSTPDLSPKPEPEGRSQYPVRRMGRSLLFFEEDHDSTNQDQELKLPTHPSRPKVAGKRGSSKIKSVSRPERAVKGSSSRSGKQDFPSVSAAESATRTEQSSPEQRNEMHDAPKKSPPNPRKKARPKLASNREESRSLSAPHNAEGGSRRPKAPLPKKIGGIQDGLTARDSPSDIEKKAQDEASESYDIPKSYEGREESRSLQKTRKPRSPNIGRSLLAAGEVTMSSGGDSGAKSEDSSRTGDPSEGAGTSKSSAKPGSVAAIEDLRKQVKKLEKKTTTLLKERAEMAEKLADSPEAKAIAKEEFVLMKTLADLHEKRQAILAESKEVAKEMKTISLQHFLTANCHNCPDVLTALIRKSAGVFLSVLPAATATNKVNGQVAEHLGHLLSYATTVPVGRSPFLAGLVFDALVLVPVVTLVKVLVALCDRTLDRSVTDLILLGDVYFLLLSAGLAVTSVILGSEPMNFLYLRHATALDFILLMVAGFYLWHLVLHLLEVLALGTGRGRLLATVVVGCHFSLFLWVPAIRDQQPVLFTFSYFVYATIFGLICCDRLNEQYPRVLADAGEVVSVATQFGQSLVVASIRKATTLYHSGTAAARPSRRQNRLEPRPRKRKTRRMKAP